MDYHDGEPLRHVGDVTSMAAERCGGKLAFEYRGEEQPFRELSLLPETPDADDHRYYTANDAGERVPVEFEGDGTDVEMRVQRWRLRQV